MGHNRGRSADAALILLYPPCGYSMAPYHLHRNKAYKRGSRSYAARGPQDALPSPSKEHGKSC